MATIYDNLPRNEILLAILQAYGGNATNPNSQNALLADIVVAAGGTVTNASSRNALLADIAAATSGCNVYLFSSANSDFLEIESFTGNLKITLAATSETGIPVAIVAGRQGAFVASTDPVNDPQWVQYEIDAVALTILLEATFDGVCGGYAKDDAWYSLDMGAPNPLLYATTKNYIMRASQARAGYFQMVTAYDFEVAGSEALSEIVLSYDAAYLKSDSSGLLNDLANDMTINKVSLQYNGIAVPVTFGGNRNITLSGSDFDVHSDAIPASSFSLGEIPRGAKLYIKTEIDVAVDGNELPSSVYDVRGSNNGIVAWYTDASGMSDTDVLGAYTYASGVTTRSEGYHPRVLGRHTTSNATAIVARGDSITSGTGDSYTSSGESGNGWFNRMCYMFTDKPAFCNVAVHGSQGDAGAADPRLTALYGYASDGVIAYGTNDIGTGGTGNLAEIQEDITTIQGQMIAAGMSSIGIVQLLPRTLSTDEWITEANQTKRPGWGDGELSNQYNTWLESAGLGYVITVDAVRGVDPNKWAVDGVAKLYNHDDIHPNTVGHPTLATEAKLIVERNL